VHVRTTVNTPRPHHTSHPRTLCYSIFKRLQDGLENIIVAAMPPPGQQPQLWELKLGQYVNRSLTLQEYRSMIDGWATWPQLPAVYEGPAFTYAYLEPVEGEWPCCLLACSRSGVQSFRTVSSMQLHAADCDPMQLICCAAGIPAACHKLHAAAASHTGCSGRPRRPSQCPNLTHCPLAGAAAARPSNATAYVHRAVGFDVVTDIFFMAVPGAEEASQAWLDDLYGKR